MQVRELLSPFTDFSLPACEILSLTDDTRTADATSLFVCIRGARFDGHTLANVAYQNGCRFFVAERPISLPDDAIVVLVESTRTALSLLASAFYRHPSRKLRVIAVTGTKGKTTVAQLIRGILDANGIPTGYIGTNGIIYGKVKRSTSNTTPNPLTLQKTLSEMHEHGMHAAVIEVSSQALLQSRVEGTQFEAAVFTNLSLDHVGPNEHSSFEDYTECKHRLFTDFNVKTAFWNADDAAHLQMRVGTSAKKEILYSATKKSADYHAIDICAFHESTSLGISFSVSNGEHSVPCRLPLVGVCNVSNALSAIAVVKELFGVSLSDAANALSAIRVDGRSECYPLPSGAIAVIDYAHNEESLRSILTSLREYKPRRLICVFGSVGERSQLRRATLGAVASSLADFSIITSDNPGNESPEKIIDEIAAAFDRSSYLGIADRREAILYAASLSKKGDILLLAGKGHETYQLIGDKKIPFDERQILSELSTPLNITTD